MVKAKQNNQLCLIYYGLLSFADLQKSMVARQQLDSQLSENKLVLDVRIVFLITLMMIMIAILHYVFVTSA